MFDWLNDCQQNYFYNYAFKFTPSHEVAVHFI